MFCFKSDQFKTFSVWQHFKILTNVLMDNFVLVLIKLCSLKQ